MKIRRTRPLSKLLTIILVLATGTAGSCARFRIEELKPNLISRCALQLQSSASDSFDGAPITVQGRLPGNLPANPAIYDGQLYMVDTLNRRVRIFSGDSGELQTIIGQKKGEIPPGVQWVETPIGIPGAIAVSPEGKIFLQSWPAPDVPADTHFGLPPEQRLPGELNVKGLRPEDSRILELGEKGNLIRRIGETGTDGTPFAYVYRLTATKDGRLYVFHNSGNDRVLSVYRNGELQHTFSKVETPEMVEDARRYRVEVEEMIPEEGDQGTILASLSFRSRKDYTPEFRKIYRIDQDDHATEILQLDEDGDYLAWTGPDGIFFLMNTEGEGDRILYRIYSATGEYLNNRLIVFPDVRSSWLDTFPVPGGKILSVRLGEKRYEIYEWK